MKNQYTMSSSGLNGGSLPQLAILCIMTLLLILSAVTAQAEPSLPKAPVINPSPPTPLPQGARGGCLEQTGAQNDATSGSTCTIQAWILKTAKPINSTKAQTTVTALQKQHFAAYTQPISKHQALILIGPSLSKKALTIEQHHLTERGLTTTLVPYQQVLQEQLK